MGLSPHVRGNPEAEHQVVPSQRSIPARTGEPTLTALSAFVGAVYPRTYGGTFSHSVHSGCSSGLSPHVRGNRCGARVRSILPGSIPARTGEPALQRS